VEAAGIGGAFVGGHIAGIESRIHIDGNVSGQVAIGKFVYQAQAPGGVVNQIMVPEPSRALPRPVQIRPRHDQTGMDPDSGLGCGLPLTAAPDLGAQDLMDGQGDQAALPNTGLTTGAVLRLALLLLLIGVEVLITVGKRDDEYTILTLPLSDI
jgi:hypothetical protein